MLAEGAGAGGLAAYGSPVSVLHLHPPSQNPPPYPAGKKQRIRHSLSLNGKHSHR